MDFQTLLNIFQSLNPSLLCNHIVLAAQ